ncbi:MAG: hypothetical protein ACRD3M_02715 [Thermoanaerobaculia bacterium]
MGEPDLPDFLPSIAHLLKRVGALERAKGIDLQAVSRLPVFQSRAWRRAIAEFLRWSGSTPDPWGGTSVFELLLCHGPSGARAIFEAYRHDRLERAATFEEAEAQLEAVRTVVSMAAYWLHLIVWDLRDAPRLSAEEFRNRRRSRDGLAGREPLEGLRRESSGAPLFPGDPTMPSLWKLH